MRNIFLVFFLFSVNIFAQDLKLEDRQVIDRIIAIVGNEVVMTSEIDAQMARMVQSDPDLDFMDKAQRLDVLNALIDEKLLLQKAIKDSIDVSDQEIDQRWGQLLESWKAQYGSIARVEQIFGKSLSRVKYEFRDQIKNQIMTQKLNYMKFGDFSISTNEVKEFYEKFKDSLKFMPDQYEISHIIKYIKVDNSAKDNALKRAKLIRDSILSGASFETLALNNSDDLTTKKEGGSLGWVKKGLLFPEFEKAAFALTKDETSLPIETPFGFHIIQTLDKKTDQVNTRHILIKFKSEGDNAKKVLELMTQIKKDIESGNTSFEEQARLHSEDENTKGFGGLIGKVTIQELPTPVQKVIREMKEGEISEPISYGNDPNKPAYQLVYFKKYYEQHKMNIEDDYDNIELIAKNYKQRELVQEWIKQLRKELHWEILE
jgi:peptidyl-prolyl cis-trans isomerase SurA